MQRHGAPGSVSSEDDQHIFEGLSDIVDSNSLKLLQAPLLESTPVLSACSNGHFATVLSATSPAQDLARGAETLPMPPLPTPSAQGVACSAGTGPPPPWPPKSEFMSKDEIEKGPRSEHPVSSPTSNDMLKVVPSPRPARAP